MARPTEYTPEAVEQAKAYIEQYAEYDHAFPSVVGLCSVINRGRTTVYEWAKDPDKDFASILDKIHEKQELIAWKKGLSGDYNANLVKLLLGKHGYHDSSNVKVEKTLSDFDEEELDRLIQDRQRQASQPDE